MTIINTTTDCCLELKAHFLSRHTTVWKHPKNIFCRPKKSDSNHKCIGYNPRALPKELNFAKLF
ncbi:hypothetical protein CGT98_13245 [Vibrio metoecus]|nr:hypothetical protein CGU00_14635 [Vibrio metoecus]PAR38582.1 hypothetical protein CGT98_13245 [Vibrio metoecus]PAR60189.1 hypothetical protein CGT90_17115 [Vibrio metoecus]